LTPQHFLFWVKRGRPRISVWCKGCLQLARDGRAAGIARERGEAILDAVVVRVSEEPDGDAGASGGER
jgi:hypothetical protein